MDFRGLCVRWAYIISHNRYQNHLSYQLYGVKPVNSKLHNISINSTVDH